MGFSGRRWNPWNLFRRFRDGNVAMGCRSTTQPGISHWKITMRSEWKTRSRDPPWRLGKSHGKIMERNGVKHRGTESIYENIREEIDSIYSYTYIHIRGIQPYDSWLFSHIIQPYYSTIFMIIHDCNHEYDILLPTNDYSWLSEGNIIGIQPYSTNPSKKAVATPIVFQLKGKS